MHPETGHTTQIQLCLDRLRAGDDSARDELIHYSCGRLLRLAHKLVRSSPSVRRWEDTEDVFQEAALRLRRALADVHPDSVAGFIGLAAKQIRRQLIDFARHYMGPQGMGAHHHTNQPIARSDASEVNRPVEATAGTAGPATLAQWTELHSSIEQLSAEEQQVFDLHYYGEIPHAEIAAILDVSEKTVKRRWRDAKMHLAERLGDHFP